MAAPKNKDTSDVGDSGLPRMYSTVPPEAHDRETAVHSPSPDVLEAAGGTAELFELLPGVLMSAVPIVRLPKALLSQLPLDAPAKQMLALINGRASFASIVKTSGIEMTLATTTCRRLIQRGIIEVKVRAK